MSSVGGLRDSERHDVVGGEFEGGAGRAQAGLVHKFRASVLVADVDGIAAAAVVGVELARIDPDDGEV